MGALAAATEEGRYVGFLYYADSIGQDELHEYIQRGVNRVAEGSLVTITVFSDSKTIEEVKQLARQH